jgi:AcrR family transcriptional regulator
VAQRAGIPLARLYRRCPTKAGLLRAYARRVDELVLADQDPEDLEEPAKDRLFEVLMRRFDILSPHRKAVRSILECTLRDPVQAMGGYRQLRRSMGAMLEAANIPTSGVRGELRLNGLCGIYLLALRTWIDDESEDQSKTMAALDSYLRRIERPAAVLAGQERAADVVRDTVQDSPVGRALNQMVAGAPGAGADDGPVIEGEAREIHEPFDDAPEPDAPEPGARPSGPGSSAVH